LPNDYEIFRICEYKKIYESFILDKDKNDKVVLKKLPDFIEFKNSSGWDSLEWKIFS
jgi:hypothetical protein